MAILKYIFKFFTKTRLRKILSSILALLVLLTSIKYLFLIPSRVKAADVYLGMNEGYGSSVSDINSTISTGTITNAVWRQEEYCKFGKCLYFDGTGDYVTYSDNANLDMGSGETVTIEGWFRTPDITSGTRTLIAKEESTGADGGYRIEMNSSGFLVFGIDNDNSSFPSDSVTSTIAYDDNAWHHFAAVKNGGTSITLYVDGVSVGTPDSSIQNDISNNDSFYIGIYNGASNGFLGVIDEVKVLRSARTAGEVKADFNGETTSKGVASYFGVDNSYLTNGLVGWWKLDDNTGTSTIDSSGNGGTGTFYEDTTANTSGPTWVNGKYGSGADFAGSNDVIRITEYPAADLGSATDSYTISAWFKTSTSFSQIGTIVQKYSIGTTNPFTLYISGVNTVTFTFAQSGNTVSLSSLKTLNDGVWHQAVAVRNANTKMAYLYIDGVLNSSATDTIVLTTSNDSDISIGNGGTTGYNNTDFTGQIDDVRIYNRSLTNAEIIKLHDYAPGPIGSWNFDENSGSTANDSSGNNYTGTLTDSPIWQTGKYGSALKFYDTGDSTTEPAVSIADDSFDSLSQGSVSMWIKPDNNGDSWQDFFGVGENTSRWWELAFDKANSAIAFSAGGAGSNCSLDLSSTITNLSSWHHVVFTDSASGNNLYIDGAKVTPTYSTGTSATDCFIADWTGGGTSYNRIGCWSGTGDCLGGEMYQGLIDNVKLYNYPITSQQVIEEMNGGHSAPGSPVGSYTARWKMDEGAGTAAKDSSINALNLTLSAQSWTTDGKYYRAWNGDGTKWLSITDAATSDKLDFAAADDFTISTWFKSDSATNPASNNEFLVTKGTVTNTGTAGYTLYASTNGKINFGIKDDGGWGASAPNTITPDDSVSSTNDIYDATWHQISAVKTGTTRIDIYVDGILNASDTTIAATSTLANAINFYLGDDDGDSTNSISGDLDDTFIFRSALSSDQVKSLYNQGSAVMGATSTDSSGNATWSAQREFCPPGNTELNCGSGDPSPIFQVPFDENTGTTPADISMNNLTPSLSGNLSWQPGKFGQSIYFDGGSNRIDYPSATLFDFGTSTPFTLQGWFKLQSTGADQDLFLRMGVDSGKAGFVMTLIAAGNKINANVRNPSPVANCRIDTSTATNFFDGNWHFITVVYNRNASCTTSDIVYYIDGKKDNNTSVGVSSGNTNQDIGVTGVQVGATTGFKGQADEVRVYNYARTAAQIAWDYNYGKPLGWWKFDENTGTPSTLNDSSGNSFSGAASGTLSSGNWVTGKFNSALNFNGSDNKITVTDTNALDLTADFTISAWINKTADANSYVLSKTNEGTTGGYALLTGSSGEVYCRTNNGSANTDSYTLTGLVSANTGWHHVVAVRSGTSCRVYVDGIDRTNTVNTHTTVTANALNLTIGSRPDTTQLLTGYIDDVRLYNYALSKQQIQTVINEGSAVRYGQ